MAMGLVIGSARYLIAFDAANDARGFFTNTPTNAWTFSGVIDHEPQVSARHLIKL
jgi:hypothetical protein